MCFLYSLTLSFVLRRRRKSSTLSREMLGNRSYCKHYWRCKSTMFSSSRRTLQLLLEMISNNSIPNSI
ncbi:unnamed protein product [Amoebophrya sp. A25]|nr:unnamed protein product [Amoebophrya sp. A25]|eukprot:GSA25T00011838001.1